MEPKNLNKTPKRVDEGFMKTLTQTIRQDAHSNSYNTIAVVHTKFSSLVSSETVYALRISPKAKRK